MNEFLSLVLDLFNYGIKLTAFKTFTKPFGCYAAAVIANILYFSFGHRQSELSIKKV
jgi:hypothetical protein